MVRSGKKSDFHEAIGFVDIPRSYVVSSGNMRKTIIVGDIDTLIKKQISQSQ